MMMSNTIKELVKAVEEQLKTIKEQRARIKELESQLACAKQVNKEQPNE